MLSCSHGKINVQLFRHAYYCEIKFNLDRNIITDIFRELKEDIALIEPKQGAMKKEQSLNNTNRKACYVHWRNTNVHMCLCFSLNLNAFR